jgi:hypothetical protein
MSTIYNDDTNDWLKRISEDGKARETFNAYLKAKKMEKNWKNTDVEPVPHKGFKAEDDLAGYENTDTCKWWQVPNPDAPLLKDTRGWYTCICAWRLVPMGVRGREWIVLELRLNCGTSLRHIIFNVDVKAILTKAMKETDIEEVIIDLRGKCEQIKLRCYGSENALAIHISLAKYLAGY